MTVLGKFKAWQEGKIAIELLKEAEESDISCDFIVLNAIVLSKICALIVDDYILDRLRND